MKKSLSGRLERLEQRQAVKSDQGAVVIYDPHSEPVDPEKKEAFFNSLRPAGSCFVVFLPSNGR